MGKFIPHRYVNGKPSIYIASPFFNKEEVQFVDQIKDTLRSIGFNVYSPKDEAGIIPEDKNHEECRKIFDHDCWGMDTCPMMVAVIDDFDPGTIFEMGYAYNAGKSIITISRKHYGINLMLAMSARAHFSDFGDFVVAMSDFYKNGKIPENIWTGDLQ